jgi:hypothetical protein
VLLLGAHADTASGQVLPDRLELEARNCNLRSGIGKRGLLEDIEYWRGLLWQTPEHRCTNKIELLTYVARYIGRPPIANSRILDFDANKIRLRYRDKLDDNRMLGAPSPSRSSLIASSNTSGKVFSTACDTSVYSRHNSNPRATLLTADFWVSRTSVECGRYAGPRLCIHLSGLTSIGQLRKSHDLEPSPVVSHLNSVILIFL